MKKELTIGIVGGLCLTLASTRAYSYRPFVGTDAAVADLHEVEIEMGPFNLARNGRDNTFTIPQTVLNYGVHERVEAVAQMDVNEIQKGPVQVGENQLSVKVVAKEGLLQEKPGDSLAFETALLLPSGVTGEWHTGFEETGIWSRRVFGTIMHFNLGGGIDQVKNDGFVFWSVIAERPLIRTLRVVGEITGQSQPELPSENSGLVGLIWETPKPNLFLDAGVRRGLSVGVPDWQYTVGFSYGFIFPKVLQTVPQQTVGEPRGP